MILVEWIYHFQTYTIINYGRFWLIKDSLNPLTLKLVRLLMSYWNIGEVILGRSIILSIGLISNIGCRYKGRNNLKLAKFMSL